MLAIRWLLARAGRGQRGSPPRTAGSIRPSSAPLGACCVRPRLSACRRRGRPPRPKAGAPVSNTSLTSSIPAHSLCRRQRLQALIEGTGAPLTVADVCAFYRDHADPLHSLCAHPFEARNVKTVASIIGDLDACEPHVAKGSPCQVPYATYTLATCQTGALSVTVADPFLAVS